MDKSKEDEKRKGITKGGNDKRDNRGRRRQKEN